ncbi:MAG: hypothetical protein KAT76_05425 [Bacteroidales bacterium]|nr:hypothetical protein [Bacteroidales bacterium]
MGRAGLLIILLLLFAPSAKAQLNYSFRQVDSIMYANTITENWDEVIQLGKEALQNDIDYYYLRARMGIAYYNKKNYRAAAVQMEKARNFNPGNALTNNLLYRAYSYSSLNPEASFFSRNLTDKQREDAGIEKGRVLTFIHFEAGPEFSDNFDTHEFKQLPRGQAQRNQDLYGNSFYSQLGMKLQVHSRVSMYVGFSNLLISKKAELQYAWNMPDSVVQHEWGFSKIFPSRPRIKTSSYDYTLSQNGVYLNANILLGSRWSFTPAIHYVHVSTKSINIDNNSRLIRDTAYYIPAIDSVAYLYYDQVSFDIDPISTTLNNFVVSLELNKQVSVFDWGIFASWSNLNGQTQYQYGFSATYYPFGNLNFYGNTTIKGLSQEQKTRPILSQLLGLKVTRFLWLEGFGIFGNLRGTNESNAFIVYNINDNINLKTGVSLTFVISPSVQLSVRYQYLQKQGYRTVSGPEIPGGTRIEELDYTNQSIIGGLKWSL